MTCALPEKSDRIRNRRKLGSRGGRPPWFDQEDYMRHTGNRLTRNRAVATGHDKPAVRYCVTVPVAAVSEWL